LNPEVSRVKTYQSPFPPGKSPFHVKGGVYIGTQKYFAKQVKGGLDALHAEIKDPALLEFIQQKFLPSSWYDVLPVYELIRAESRALGQTVARYLHERAVFQVEQDIGGVYRFLLKLASAQSVALRLPRMLTQVLDFGEHDAKQVAPGHVEAKLRGYPAMLWEWYSSAFTVYSERALALAGAREPVTLVRNAEPDGAREGVELIRFDMDVRWTAL
jgi:hypothetical protein